jgi:hypothetical protein
LIGNVVPRPSAADAMTEAPEGADELPAPVLVVVPVVVVDVVVLLVGEIEVVILTFAFWVARHGRFGLNLGVAGCGAASIRR